MACGKSAAAAGSYWNAKPCAATAAWQVANSILSLYVRVRLNEAKKDTRNILVSAVELHDPLLHLLLIWQEFVHSQKVPVCYIIKVTHFRCN